MRDGVDTRETTALRRPPKVRLAAERRLAASPPPARLRFDLHATIADGGPVPVWLGDHELPIGDLGHPRTDATVLRAMLAQGGGGAKLLRSHGIDEAALGGEPGRA